MLKRRVRPHAGELGSVGRIVSTREEKHRRALLSTIEDLRVRMLPLLQAISEGRNTGFFTTEQNNPWGTKSCSREGSEILTTAKWVVAEAKRLGESEAATLAAKTVEAFQLANDLSKPHRLGPIRLAQQLLAQITEAA
jgi:hypothetical protein